MKIKNILFIFIIAFLLNFVWEYFHSALYSFYQHELITMPILLRAAAVDAIMITTFFLLSAAVPVKYHLWLVLAAAAATAIALEVFALQTGRWEYNDLMPIIPILNIGLTPVLQLPFLSYITFKGLLSYETK